MKPACPSVHPAHGISCIFCGRQRVLLRKRALRCSSCRVCAAGLWFQGPGPAEHTLGPAAGGSPGGPVPSLQNCRETDTGVLSGGPCSSLGSSAWTFPAPRNPNPFLTPALRETGWIFLSSPNPSPRLLCYSFIHDCDFSMVFFSFFFSW